MVAEKRRARRAEAVSAAWSRIRSYGLWLPVIVAPMVLAWQAQAEQGGRLYGPVGWLLPVLTECAAWVISFEIARQRRRGVPVGRALVAMWLVAGAMAGLSFLHGLETSVITAVVMAVVAVAGLVIHQIKVTLDAGSPQECGSPGLGRRWWWTPVRSVVAAYRSARTGMPVTAVYDGRDRNERRHDRRERRQVRAIRRAAVDSAVGRVHRDGTVTLLHVPSTVELARTKWLRRPVLRAVSPPPEALASVTDNTGTAAHPPVPAAAEQAVQEPTAAPAAGPGSEASGSTSGSVSGAVQRACEVRPDWTHDTSRTSAPEALPAGAESGSESAAELPSDELIDRAERLERQYLSRSGGKRGLPFREAPRRLGVRYETARAALIAARARMATESTEIAA